MRIAYVGHATVEMTGPGYRLLTDPVLRPRLLHLRRLVPEPAIEALREPDCVLISHAHFDHLDLRSLALVEPKRVIAPRGCGATLRRRGIAQVTEVEPGEQVRIGEALVTATLLDHDGRRHPLHRARATLGYLVESDVSAFFAGDTGPSADLGPALRRSDAVLLPVWGWGARLGPDHLGPEQAARIAAELRPRVAIPIHWGTLASPRVPWRADPGEPARRFASALAAIAPGVEARVLEPGAHTDVDPTSPRRGP
ncbi:MBL fold metallo-hydrolase [Thermoleophilia bacterium SCSIO 60948]|nr:MBL fold metallo-hydrolase [Thermoleophilia bacterium SCSIO 60948]